MIKIETVKHSGDGYLVNGIMFVPKADGNGDYKAVQEWVVSGGIVEPQYSAGEIAEQARADAKTDRDTALNSMTHTLADGSVVQTRPSDLTNFQIAIDSGVSKDWVLKDNTVRLLTVVEMGECLASGIAQAEAIWSDYTTWLKAQ